MSRRVKMTADILRLMENPQQVRNIGLIGHIDHGKTTLSDSLLAEAGLLAKSLAGEARVLDYLEEEQRRGITMKSANISLVYEHSLSSVDPFLINLVDTPGHLDFSGKVTRALRIADGVVVIVDSVEEVSSQTETVVRQALQEGLRPLLFINKIDRLFKELKLDSDEIKNKFSRIIQDFNKLIYMYGDALAKDLWLVSAEKGSVLFGSALHKWGFVIPQLVQNKHNFDYFQHAYDNDTYRALPNQYPVWKSVLAAVVQFLPNPVEAQKYRIKTIWSGDCGTDVGKALLNCDPKGPLVIGLSKVQKLKNRLIGTGRIFSGTLKRGQSVWLVNGKEKSSINQLSIFMGSRLESVSEVPAGNIAAIGGIKKIRSGETLFGVKAKEDAKPFETVKYVSEPVVTVAIEPDMLKNLNQLQEILEEIQVEDPNISVEISSDSGECLLSGMGPLHLEIVANTIKERGVEVEVSKPTSVFHESIENISSYHDATSPNGLNSIRMLVMRMDTPTVAYLRGVKSQIIENDILREQELPQHTSFSVYESRGFWNVDKFQNVIISRLKEDTGIEYDDEDNEVLESKTKTSKKKSRKGKSKNDPEDNRQVPLDMRGQIMESIHGILSHGVIAQEPISEVKIVIKEVNLAKNREDANFFEISTMIQDAFMACLREAQPVLLEPIYTLMIATPEEYIGTVTSLVNQFQGKILEITQDAFKSHVTAKMSVRQSIDFAQEIRGQTSGRVFWQNLFDKYSPVPEHERESIIQDIKFRKGLAFF
ncbi:Elongation factor 2 [Candidatus Lokiarchaeum ossiferum]|uniref:Elongation factor 2 n=1 Tax=Candidatus Lokiarchaeum ossiferum TaxID=2951803 RepID=A0ABY6HYS0_9ARCH|nr:Elongation factor 2 [Candidatus Lokiarchaeum sp. B-35]